MWKQRERGKVGEQLSHDSIPVQNGSRIQTPGLGPSEPMPPVYAHWVKEKTQRLKDVHSSGKQTKSHYQGQGMSETH